MTRLLLLGLTFIFSLVFCAPSPAAAAPAAGLEALRGNHLNDQAWPAGTLKDADKTIEACTDSTLPRVQQLAETGAHTLWSASFLTYYLGMNEIRAGHWAQGAAWLDISAHSFLNPFAMVQLAKMHYLGAKEGGFEFPKNLPAAQVHVTMAFAIAGVCEEHGGDPGKAILDRVVTGGLGVQDGLHKLTVEGQHDEKRTAENTAPFIKIVTDQFCQMYGFPRTLPLNEQALYGGPAGAALKTPEQLRHDQTYIAEATQAAGTLEKAAAAALAAAWTALEKDPVLAVKRFNQAWLLDPQSPAVRWGLGTALSQAGRHPEALEMFRQALDLSPRDARLHGDAARAEMAFALTARQSPAFVQRHLQRAIALCRQGAALDPGEGTVSATLAIVHYQAGDYPAAWQAVHAARTAARPAPLDPRFLQALQQKLPDPNPAPPPAPAKK